MSALLTKSNYHVIETPINGVEHSRIMKLRQDDSGKLINRSLVGEPEFYKLREHEKQEMLEKMNR